MGTGATTEPAPGRGQVPAGMAAHRLTPGQQRTVTVSALRLGAGIMTSTLLVRPAVGGLLGGAVLAWLVLSAVAVAATTLLPLLPAGPAGRLAHRWVPSGRRVEPVVAALDTVAFCAVTVTSPSQGYGPVVVLGLVLLGQAPLTWGWRGVVLVVAPLTVAALVEPAGLFDGIGGRVALVTAVAAAAALALALRRVLHRQAAVTDHVQATLSMVFDHSPAPAAITCVTGTLLEVNTAMTRLCGRAPERLLGHRLLDLVHPDDAGALGAVLASVVRDGADGAGGAVPGQQVEVRLDSSGGPRWVCLLVGMVPAGAGMDAQVVVQVEDVQERRAAAQRLEHEATHDALTGLPNRRAVQRDLERLTAGGDRPDRAHGAAAAGGALVLLDLDGFKEVNDALGHQAGDDLLVVAADRLRGALHEGEEAGRLAGDELVVVAGGVDGDQGAHDLGRRVLDGLLGPARLSAGEVELRASAGVRRIVAGSDDAASVMRDADAALYRAKRSGGCRLEVAEVPGAGHGSRADVGPGEQPDDQPDGQGAGAGPAPAGRRYSA